MRLIIIFLLISNFSFAQSGIRDYQIKVDTPYTSLFLMSNDTVSGSATYKYGDWKRLYEDYGININTSTARTIYFSVDTTQLATQYDLTLISGSDDQNLTIEGSGPTYDIAINDGSDVTISAAGILALSESPANTLVFTATEVDGSTSNELTQIFIDGVDQSTGAVTLDFDNADFALVESPADYFDITIEPERIQDLAGAMVTGNTETGITVTYEDSDGTLDFVATDASATNEAWTADADDATAAELISSQTVFFKGNRGIDTDLVTGTVDSIAFVVDGSEWNTVTNWETDNWMLMYDAGTSGTGTGLERIDQADFIAELESLLTVPGDGNGIYDGDGSVPTDVDASILDSLEFGSGILKLINAANDVVGIGAENPTSKLHIRNTSGGTFRELELEDTGPTVEILSKGVSPTTTSPFTITAQNKDSDIDISGDYYTMGSISFTKASATLPGGSISFAIGYDSLNQDQVLTVNSRPTGATDGYVGIVGGLRYKWAANAGTSITLNLGDYGLTTTAAGTKTVTLPDAVAGIVGQFYMIFNSGAGTATVAITGGSGDVINGDVSVLQNESIQVHCPAANVWVITN